MDSSVHHTDLVGFPSFGELGDQTTFDEDALTEMVKVTITKATGHDELDLVVHPFDKTLSQTMVEVVGGISSPPFSRVVRKASNFMSPIYPAWCIFDRPLCCL